MSEIKKEIENFKCGNRTFQCVWEYTDRVLSSKYVIDDHGVILATEKIKNGRHAEGVDLNMQADWIRIRKDDNKGYALEYLYILRDSIEHVVVNYDKEIEREMSPIEIELGMSPVGRPIDGYMAIETVTSPEGRLIRETGKIYMGMQKHGLEKLYDAAGRLQSQINYFHGVRDGEAIFYNPDGSIKERRHYEKGVWLGADLMSEIKDLLASGEKTAALKRLSKIIPVREQIDAGGNGAGLSHFNVMQHFDVAIIDERHLAVGIIYENSFWAPHTMNMDNGIECIWNAEGAIIDTKDGKIVGKSINFPSVKVRDKDNAKKDIHINTSNFLRVDGKSAIFTFYNASQVLTVPQTQEINAETLTPGQVIANARQKQM